MRARRNNDSKIHTLRGERVMLDFDLAELFSVSTRRLKEAVRRNIERFPDEFMFELTQAEFKNLRSQIATSSWGGTRYPPFAFTEHGVAMLSSILNSPKAIQTNIAIVKAFISLRRYAFNYSELAEKIKELETKFDREFADINEVLRWLSEENQARYDENQALQLHLIRGLFRHRTALRGVFYNQQSRTPWPFGRYLDAYEGIGEIFEAAEAPYFWEYYRGKLTRRARGMLRKIAKLKPRIIGEEVERLLGGR